MRIDAGKAGLEDSQNPGYSISPFFLPTSLPSPAGSTVTAEFPHRVTAPPRSRLWRPGLLCATLAALAASGCVQRRITIRSNPPGALVYVDKYEIGKTPCSVAYTYYGTREIKLVRDGYETLTVMQWIPPPWYQIPPLDFVSENVVPAEIRDERTYTYQLVPTRVVPTDQLLGRAESLRRATQLERLAAPPPAPRRPPLAPPSSAPLDPGNGLQPGVAPPGYLPGPGPNVYPGPGVYFPPGNYAPPGNWGPGYPAPGMLPSPGLLPAPGPSPPRGPQ
ncbi:MAG TPA: PEGA domain-containing protein [Pirellulales bacterium]|nr:PEGA domain-containing protein [Pirellulales bacterium]